eukprot:symbB.v1.2.026905.t1/scaffold2726.1/size72210/3
MNRFYLCKDICSLCPADSAAVFETDTAHLVIPRLKTPMALCWTTPVLQAVYCSQRRRSTDGSFWVAFAMSLVAACCRRIIAAVRMVLQAFRIQSREALYRVPYPENEEEEEEEEVPPQQAPDISEEELARILGNTVPARKKLPKECDKKAWLC